MSRKNKGKQKNLVLSCKQCGDTFLAADYKANQCDSCRNYRHFCECGCGGIVIGITRRYLPFHSANDKDSPTVKAGHKKQGRNIAGGNNPSKRDEVRRKISQALLGRVCWKEGKTEEEVNETRKRIVEGTMNGIRYQKKYVASDGNKYRSSLEVSLVDFLYAANIEYSYERPLEVDGTIYYPDFTLLDGEKIRCLIEPTGSAYDSWRKKFKTKVQAIRKKYPTLPIVIVTYASSAGYLKDLEELEYVRIWLMDRAMPDTKYLIVESDYLNFDYSHFLPWHKGKCADFHGHSATITVVVGGVADDKGMIIDFGEIKRVAKEVINLIDHKVFVPFKCLKRIRNGQAVIEFVSKERFHRLEIPESEIVILDNDSTIENISTLLAHEILSRMPYNITEVIVRANEGIGKSAAAIACGVSRDSYRESYKISERPGDFLRTLSFYQRTSFIRECYDLE